ncbi:signal peptidase I [Kineococcus glutinatus]|uniref:Signal peptidase I n=1 Tax=Kineococcus glutinatus TaxID=1070872 RepID=A0ABP9HA17_9ACTN
MTAAAAGAGAPGPATGVAVRDDEPSLVRRRRPGRRIPAGALLLVLAAALVLSLLVRTVLVQAFSIPSDSMDPTLVPGERVVVLRSAVAGDISRGDVVVFDGAGTFAPAPEPATGPARIGEAAGVLLGFRPGEVDFVKRVVGLPGDRVTCCDDTGRITVNGEPLEEPYVHPGDAPSEVRFDIEVPAGRLWLMGDHRSDSADSRAHLGDPGGGTVAVDDVIGRVVAVTWPLSALRTVAAGGER